jgi:GT2 family glycosyltransferase
LTDTTPTISAIIPAFEAADVLPRCLAALRDQSAAVASFEIIVVDDGSNEPLTDLVPESVTLLRHEQNRGAAAARNTGAATARGKVLLFVDADLVAHKGLIAATAELFERESLVAATGCYDAKPANEGWFARYKALWTWHCWQHSAGRSKQSSHLQGAMGAVSREVFEQHGGFDERYRGGNVEDYEFSQRLRDAGHHIVFDQRIGGRHHFPGFITVARNYWNRTRMWVRLKATGRTFSSGQAGARSGAIALLALCALICLLCSPLHTGLLVASGLSTLTFLCLMAPFLLLALRRDGPVFAVYCSLCHFALSMVIGAAALSSPLGTGSRDLQPTTRQDKS